MSLRLTALVPDPIPDPHPTPDSGSMFSLTTGDAPSYQVSSNISSGKEISTLFPFVKPFFLETPVGGTSIAFSSPIVSPPLASSMTSSDSSQGAGFHSEWIVQKTLQTTWHLYHLPTSPQGTAFPPSSLFVSSELLSESLQGPQTDPVIHTGVVPQTSRSGDKSVPIHKVPIHKYLKTFLVFSCGAAASTLLYADPMSSLKALVIGSSLATAQPTPTPDVTDFVETAQRQLYHLDRLTAQHTEAIEQQLQGLNQGLDLALVPPPSGETWAAAPALAGEAPPVDTTALIPPDRTLEDASIDDAPAPVEDFTAITPPDLPSDLPSPPSGIPEPLVSSPLSQLAYRANLPIPAEQGGELLGVLEQGEQSMALFKLNGTIEQVTVGQSLANGATFTGTQDGKAVLQMGENQVPLAVGQSF